MEDTNYFYNFNLDKLNFQKKRKTYFIYEFENFKNKLINFKSVKVNIPFGVENYNSKYILNLEYLNNNFSHNQIVEIKKIENFFSNLKDKNISLHLKEELEDKTFSSSLNKRKDSILFRTHLKVQKKNIISEFKKNNSLIIFNELKSHVGYFNIELKSLWTSKDKYGLIWIVKNGSII
jgi:hypothetical protein